MAPANPLGADTSVTLLAASHDSYTVDQETYSVGPFLASMGETTSLLVYCIDAAMNPAPGYTYRGTAHVPTNREEAEAAFLIAYTLTQDSRDPNFVDDLEGPVMMAIWELMQTLGDDAPDPRAAQYIALAEYAYEHGLIEQSFISCVQIFDSTETGKPSFVVSTCKDPGLTGFVFSDIPEPPTWMLAALVFPLAFLRPARI